MADRRIENSRLLRDRLARGSVHYASTPTLVNVGLNDQDSSPYNSSSGNDDSALDHSYTNNDDIYHNTNSSSNSSDNSNGYSVGHHASYQFANKNFSNLTNITNNNQKPYFDTSSLSTTLSSRTFRKNNSNARPINFVSNPNSNVTINSTNVTHHIIHPNIIRQCQYGNPDNRMTNSSTSIIPNTNTTNLLNSAISNQQSAPGHVRFTSASTATSSVSSYSSSNVTHPKSILRRKNLNSSSNVMTSSNNNHNQNSNQKQNNGWDTQARRSSCGALIQQNNEEQAIESTFGENADDSYQDPNLSVTSLDIAAIESTYKGHKTKVFVCQSMANLYTCPKTSTMSNSVSNWVLTFTGVPVLLLDLGTTRSRTKRQIQLLLVEKGTCFTLWQDVVDNLTRYSSTNDGLFHTLHLSTDHSVRVGLSFDSQSAAHDFHNKVLQLTNDPANVALKGPRRNLGPTKSHYYLDNLPNKNEKDQKKSNKIPNKMDISQPCGFQHVVSVSQSDFKKYFSLQTFVPGADNNNVNNKSVQNNNKNQQPSRTMNTNITNNTIYHSPGELNQMQPQPQQQHPVPLPLLPSDSSNSPMSTSSSNSSTTSSTSGDYMQRRKKSPAPPPPLNFSNARLEAMGTMFQSKKPISNMLTTSSRSCHNIYQI